MPGMPERRTHDYARHDVTSLFAAFNIADGTVIGELHRRHRHQEWLRFLRKIDKSVPQDLDVYVICDNYGTHKIPDAYALEADIRSYQPAGRRYWPAGSGSWLFFRSPIDSLAHQCRPAPAVAAPRKSPAR
jgi:hypothetical protein